MNYDRTPLCRLLIATAAVLFLLTLGSTLSVSAQKQTGKNKTEEQTPAPYTGPKKRIAVMNMDVSIPDSNAKQWADLIKRYNNIHTTSDVGLKLSEMMTTALQNTGRFVLVERQNIDDVRDEIKVGEELGNEKTRVKKGNVLGAQILVRCAVTEFSDNKSESAGGVHVGPLTLGGGGKVASVTVDVKMVDAETSKVLAVSTASGDSKSQGSAIGLNFGAAFGKSTNEPIEKATRNAISKAVAFIVEHMEKVPWEGRIALVSTGEDGAKRIVLNRGEEDGLHVGDRVLVFHPGESIKDPETGELLGRDEDRLVGETKVTWTDKRVARIAPIGDKTFDKSDIIKLPDSK